MCIRDRYIELDTQRKTLLEKYNELKNMRQKKQQEIKDKEKEKDLLQVKAKKDTIDKHKLEEKKAVVHKWKATKLTQQDIEYELKELSYQKYKRQQILQKEQQVKELAQKKALVLELSLIHISEPTRLGMISYAVFCLKKKKKEQRRRQKSRSIQRDRSRRE
eukprot:TRINITY_DN21294_c0_g1_i1.p2 TRINITY_DN21294_c0_g1~~TRINITY_DN21294_c0_g1_i1.p2  ORF type:complete len:162 (+),score=35.65 TRINITY_DN21294_c0_g1_i1:185-670(+)